jgi:hypothetical protein
VSARAGDQEALMRKALLTSLLLTFALAAPVAAAPPSNDTFDGATVVKVGDVIDQDTTEAAEADKFEDELNLYCGAPLVAHGVWFQITVPTTQLVGFEVVGSSYTAGLMLFAGAPAPESLLDCGPDVLIGELAGGQTYHLLAFGDGFSEQTSGNLHLVVREGVPAPEIDFAVDHFANVDRNGVVHLTGTVTCTSTNGTGFVGEVFGELTQRVGRFLVRGLFYNPGLAIPCDGTSQPWEAFAVGETGIFAGGKAATLAMGIGCTDFCDSGYTEATIQLRKGR